MKRQTSALVRMSFAAAAALMLASGAKADSTPTFTIPDGGVFIVPGVFQATSAATNHSDYEIKVLVKALGSATYGGEPLGDRAWLVVSGGNVDLVVAQGTIITIR